MKMTLNRHRGFSTLEVVLALSLFLVVAAGLASAATRMASSAVRTEARAAANAMLERQLDSLESRPFDSLLGVFDAPDPCGEPGTADGRRSCVKIGSTTYRVTFAVDAGDDPAVGPGRSASSITLTASTRLDDGTNISSTRVVVAPQVGFTSDGAVLRITATSEDAPPAVNIMNAAGDVVLDGIPFEGSVAVARVPGGACATGSGGPCRVALSVDPNSWWRTGDLTLAAAQITSPGFSLTPGTLTDTTIDVAPVATATVRVLARPDGAAVRTGAPERSVCVWVTFDDGTANRAVPYCNTEPATNGGFNIPVESWPHPTTGEPRPFSETASLRVYAENPAAATCPTAAAYPYGAPLGHNGAGWVPADVCSTWTWGVPTLFGATGDSPSALGGAGAEVHPSAAGRSYDLIFTELDLASAPVGRPATGSGTVGIWSKPRAAASASPAGCATDSNPATLCSNSTAAANLPTPETAPTRLPACAANMYCYSTANAAPRVTAPGGVRAVLTPVSDTAFEVRAVDPEGAALQMRVVPGFGLGVDRIFNDATGTPVGTAAVTAVSPGVWKLRYNWAADRPQDGWGPTVELIAVEFSDTAGATWSSVTPIHFYSQSGPLLIDADPATFDQGSSPAPYTVRVLDTAGAGLAGHDVVLEGVGGPTPDLVSAPVTATTGSDGTATFDVPAAAAAAGINAFQVRSVSHPLIRTETTAVVTAAPGEVTVTADPAAPQGGQLNAAVTVTDTVGAPLPGVTVTLEGRRGASVSSKIRPSAGACVTNPAGQCASAVRVAGDSPAGEHTLVARVADVAGDTPFVVDSAVAGIRAGDGASGTGNYLETISSDAPYSHWSLGESTGTLLDGVGGRHMTVTGPARRATAALVGAGASVGFDANNAKACSPAMTLPATGASIEGWVKIGSHKPAPGEWSEIAGIRNASNHFALTSGDGTNQTRPTLWLRNGGVDRKVVGANPLTGGRVYQLVGTYTYDVGANTTTARLYVDGDLAGTTTFTGQVSAAGPVCAGAFASAATGMSLHGELDELSVYSAALPAPTVARHFRAGGVDGASGSVVVPQGGAAQLSVTVTDGADDPMADQTVAVTSNNAGVTVGAATITTSASGVATVGVAVAESVPAGALADAITVSVGGRTLDVTVAVRQVPSVIDLQSATVTIGGRGTTVATVIDTAGDPVAGARVTFSTVGDSWPGMRFSASATTDGTGKATAVISPAVGTPPGSITLRARLSSLTDTAEISFTGGVSLDRPGGSAAPVRLPAGGSGEWAYQIVDSTGEPVAGADVTLTCDSCGLHATPAAMYTDDDGWARTTINDSGGANPAGNFTMTVGVAGQTIPVTVTVTSTATSLTAQHTSQRVAAGASTTFRVRATNAAGDPSPGVVVRADGDQPNGVKVRGARTDANGYATVTVTAGTSAGTRSVSLTTGGATLELTLVVTP